jgi:hypothetical protein
MYLELRVKPPIYLREEALWVEVSANELLRPAMLQDKVHYLPILRVLPFDFEQRPVIDGDGGFSASLPPSAMLGEAESPCGRFSVEKFSHKSV